jgi:anti-anti-sigma factor
MESDIRGSEATVIYTDMSEPGPVVYVDGDLGPETAPTLDKAVRATLTGDATKAIVDLSACRYIDSAGLGVLFQLAGLLRSGGGRLIVIRPQPHVLRILQLVRLTDERGLQVFSDLESALA